VAEEEDVVGSAWEVGFGVGLGWVVSWGDQVRRSLLFFDLGAMPPHTYASTCPCFTEARTCPVPVRVGGLHPLQQLLSHHRRVTDARPGVDVPPRVVGPTCIVCFGSKIGGCLACLAQLYITLFKRTHIR
jgi:hypothetical protein